MAKLVDECERLDMKGTLAIHVVTDSPNDIRVNGMLRANARVLHPGAAISFTSRLGAMTYPCDVFENRWGSRPDWQANLRAIALGLEALRQLDRYGMAGKQYVGYLALPAGTGQADDSIATVAGAERFLRELMDDSMRTAPLRAVWRAASLKTHPDANGGEARLWEQVQQAGQRLNLTVGLKT
jgi:hypothetical protein